ncbi:hypothetical protein HZS38_00050 [Xenorhabdus nematophila]|uniref:hypothetical protein n=1 Tax=Xenorhabdus nematophila TaxID=628 RepID=UPI000542AB73|nr:hypothetical protein [Xenorhabdus nematophila]CEE91843.1 conserved hypothetical protein [Xenorhabdus nematophila str. Anatoliense]CEF33473.1 conserved hypothetical protein [Xenorhabdus nematophila str. Websteri]AYA39119.1 hypothetical protein D3790_00170 [Xenorhabdus nematophila]KHD27479.1 hypothetical protein LH67_17805 [Xenorhabdus nematophila]MBA0017703.1 hypothetical protein [Xenorhabdus nematophila]
MITLSQEQVAKFIDAEDEVYVTNVRKRIQSEHAELVRNESEQSLHKRLKKAYLDLIDMGFKDEKLIRSYLCLTASNPDYHGAPAIQKMLKGGSHPEQQYRDYLRITAYLQKRRA